MQFGVFGTGMVGQALASKLVSLGDRVMMGARNSDNEKAVAWTRAMGALASQGSFADAARFGEMVLNATSGTVSLEVLNRVGADNLSGKILIDVSNPLDFSAGMPPTLTICNTESLGEQIQSAFPSTRVVKALNTVNAEVMVNPSLVPGAHNVFMCGNDAQAKTESPLCWNALGGRLRVSSTLGTSPAHGVRRCTCRCGYGSGEWSGLVTSTSRWSVPESMLNRKVRRHRIVNGQISEYRKDSATMALQLQGKMKHGLSKTKTQSLAAADELPSC